MQNLRLAGALLLSTLSFEMGAVEQHAEAHRHRHEDCRYQQIRTNRLKRWYDRNIEMNVVDSRSEKYFSGIVLPNAIWLPFDASKSEVKRALPSKDAVIVVYCLDSDCPMSAWMAERLVDEGYTEVYKYTEGLKAWINHGYGTE